MTKTVQLQLIADKIASCTKCPDLVESRHLTVPGEGNVNSKIVILGQCPGENESKEGRPFIGKAGQLLDNIIKACGVKREDFYILNVLKCWPFKNRNPTFQEVNNCRPFLDLQLAVLNPDLIVCLGTYSSQSLLKTDAPISQIRGIWQDFKLNNKLIKVMPTFHPSFGLRNKEAKGIIYQDLLKVLQEFKNLNS